jgi:hypothetical protein
MKKAAERKAWLEANGDNLHYTSHGCHCLLNWTYNGKDMEGCSSIETNFSLGFPWCQVTEECEMYAGSLNGSPAPVGEGAAGEDGEGGEAKKQLLPPYWDFCTLPESVDHHLTLHGCHCMPRFEYNDRYLHSCSKTSKGNPWCYVFESEDLCNGSLRTERGKNHWDTCYREVDSSPFLTVHGCHCMPSFIYKEKYYDGCTKLDEFPDPMCVVLEDEALCKGAIKLEGTDLLIDQCTIYGDSGNFSEDILSGLPEAGDENCHCQPNWEHEKKTYQGCTFTESSPNRTMCYILEDARKCPLEDGVDNVDNATNRRWRYCGASATPEPPAPTPAAPQLPAPAPPAPPPPEEPKAVSKPVRPLKVNIIPVIVPVGAPGNEAADVAAAGEGGAAEGEVAEGVGSKSTSTGAEESNAWRSREACATVLTLVAATALAACSPSGALH